MEPSKPLTKSTRKKTSVAQSGSYAESREDRSSRIAVAAYYKAQARGFQPGHELDDWLAAEAEEKK